VADILALEEFESTHHALGEAVRACAPYRPLYVKIKLTWLCNLRCEMCNVWRTRRKNRLTFPVLQALAADMAALGTQKVHLSGGEVLLLPNIIDIIDLFAGQGMQVNLTTNGTRLTHDMAGRLAASGVHNVSISLDGATAQAHDRLRGRGNWKKTVKGIRRLRRAAEHARRKMHIRINTVITRRNYLDLAGLPELIRSLGADRMTLIPVDDKTGGLRLNKERIRRYNREIAPALASKALELGLMKEASQAYPFGLESAQLEASKNGGYALGLYQRQPCYMPWLHALIAPRGRVYACCMLRSQSPLGNFIDDGGFKRLWEGQAYRSFRQQMLDPGRRPALCHSCDDFTETNSHLQRLLWPELIAAGQDG